MLALLLAITMTVLGLGWPFNRLIRWLLPSLDRYAGAISVTTLVTLVTVSWAMVDIQRGLVTFACGSVKR
jgi:hypothetical protein